MICASASMHWNAQGGHGSRLLCESVGFERSTSKLCLLCRVGQNRIYTPYMTVCLMISLPKIPCIHRIYMVLANPMYTVYRCLCLDIKLRNYLMYNGYMDTPKSYLVYTVYPPRISHDRRVSLYPVYIYATLTYIRMHAPTGVSPATWN